MVILYIGPSILIEEVKYDWVQFLTWLQLCIREYFTVISPIFSLYFELTLKKKQLCTLYYNANFYFNSTDIYCGPNFVSEVMVGILPLSLGLIQQKDR